MVKFKKPESPLNYSFCNQKVTVYRAALKEDGFECKKVVYENAFLDFKKVVSVNKTGGNEVNSLLQKVYDICCNLSSIDADLKPKDKVLLGLGEDILTREEWAKFIPSNRAGLVVIETVDPKYYRGNICHVEASG